jgi:predicted esterase
MPSTDPIVIQAQGKHTATIIVCHGLGDSGAGWVFLAEQFLQQKKLEQVKFIFPNAPSIPITINGGMRMPGWYDITSLNSIDRGEDEVGVTQSKGYLHGLIRQEIAAGIPSERIVLGGFSQGGAMSLIAGLTCPQKLAGVFGLSSYLLLQNKFESMARVSGDANLKTPVFLGHGNADPVVKYEFGKLTAEALKGMGFDVDFRTYP